MGEREKNKKRVVGDQFRLTYQSIQVLLLILHRWSGGQSQQCLHPHSTCPQSTKQWQFSLAFGFNLFFTSQEESLEIDWNCYFILPLSSILIWAWFFSFLSWGLIPSITVLGSDFFHYSAWSFPISPDHPGGFQSDPLMTTFPCGCLYFFFPLFLIKLFVSKQVLLMKLSVSTRMISMLVFESFHIVLGKFKSTIS